MRGAKRLLASLLLASAGRMAQAAPSCSVPPSLPAPHIEGASAEQPARTVPITRYTLALIWQPQHCRHPVPGAESLECAADRAGFVLHGLWPDGANGSWPQWCRPARPLPERIIRAHYCATPSPQLLQHEWAKHGTCMEGATPERFFALSSRLFAQVRAPDMRALSYDRALTADRFASAFASANPRLSADMIRLNLDRRSWLQEVWICLDRRFHPSSCPAEQGGAPRDAAVRIWRGD